MSVIDSARQQLARAHQAVTGKKPQPASFGTALWSAIGAAFHGWVHLVGFVFTPFAKIIEAWSDMWLLVAGADRQIFGKVVAWLIQGYLAAIYTYVNKRVRQLLGLIATTRRDLTQLALGLFWLARAYTVQQVGIERRARQRAIRQAEADTRRRVRWLHQAIEREAVAGYRATKVQRLDLIQRVADLIANHDPAVRALVGDLVSGLLDLAVIDDPLARLAMTFALRHIIDRLTIDKAIGRLLNALLTSVLGAPPPNDLASVITDLSVRIGAMEGQWADFMAHGGPEVEQAGDEWKAITSPVADLALLAFVGTAAVAPGTWAREVAGLFGPIVDGTLIAAADLIRKA